MSMNFDDIIQKVHSFEMKKVSVAAAQDEAVLEAVVECKKRGIADAILVGDVAKMNEIAAAYTEETGIDMQIETAASGQYRSADRHPGRYKSPGL